MAYEEIAEQIMSILRKKYGENAVSGFLSAERMTATVFYHGKALYYVGDLMIFQMPTYYGKYEDINNGTPRCNLIHCVKDFSENLEINLIQLEKVC